MNVNCKTPSSLNDNYAKIKKIKRKRVQINPLDVTESLGYQTYRRGVRKPWSKEDDMKLKKAVDKHLVELGYVEGIKSIRSIHESQIACKKLPWEKIVQDFDIRVRKPKDVRKRWANSLDPNLKKGRWTAQEDECLLKSYEKHGSQWLKVSHELEGRTEDQCAKRYIEVLDPSTKDRLREWSLEEDLALISKVKTYGTKWRQISSEMESRPSLTCRNRWRKIITMIMRGKASEVITKAVESGGEVFSSQDKLKLVFGDFSRDSRSNADPFDEDAVTFKPSVSPGQVQSRNSPASVSDEEILSTSSSTSVLTQVIGPTANQENESKGPDIFSESKYSHFQATSSHTFFRPSSFPVVSRSDASISTINTPLDHQALLDLGSNSDQELSKTTDFSGSSRSDPYASFQSHPDLLESKYNVNDVVGLKVGGLSISNEILVNESLEQVKEDELSISMRQHTDKQHVSHSFQANNSEHHAISPFGFDSSLLSGTPQYDLAVQDQSFGLQTDTHSNSKSGSFYMNHLMEFMGNLRFQSTTYPNFTEISPRRMAHFKSLPSNVKLQLGSSQLQRNETDHSEISKDKCRSQFVSWDFQPQSFNGNQV